MNTAMTLNDSERLAGDLSGPTRRDSGLSGSKTGAEGAAAPAATAARPTVTIASISGQDWYISRTYGVFHIPACPQGSPCALLLVSARGDAMDLGDNRKFPFTISAREIAEDLVQDLACHGVFVCAAARPTEEELARAAAARELWYKQLLFEGDQMWARSHNYREISDAHRRAALALGLERPWAYVPQKMVECPVCGEKLKPHVALCRHCGAILDREKAALHGLRGLDSTPAREQKEHSALDHTVEGSAATAAKPAGAAEPAPRRPARLGEPVQAGGGQKK